MNNPIESGLSGTTESQETISYNKQILIAKRKGVKNIYNNEVFNLGKAQGTLKKYVGNYDIILMGEDLIKIMTKDKDHHIG